MNDVANSKPVAICTEELPLDELLERLTPAQREAVLHIDGPLLILAGPGSGKTRVVTHRIAHLLRTGVRASQILALTFTNKAAEEMKSRLELLAPGQQVWMSTFHRFCAKLLRTHASLVGLEPNYTIFDTSDSRQAMKRAIEVLNLDPTHYTPDRIAGVISTAKNNLVKPEKFTPALGDPLESVVAQVYPMYQKQLLQANAVDFDDLLLHVALLLRECPEIRQTLDQRYRYILVDEYQDTNLTQYAIARGLSIDYPNLCATGDPDQSIYGWRGANIRNILEFEQDFPDVKVVRLEQNYRSTQRILRAAQQLIKHNRRRKAKNLFTENDEGKPVRLTLYPTQKEEAEGIAGWIDGEIRGGRRRPRDFAVFYRTNALSRAVEDAMRHQGIPYQMVHGLEFFQRKEIKDTLAYLQLLNNPRNDVAFLRVINTPPRGIGQRTIESLNEHAQLKKLPLLEAARQCGLIESLPKRAAVAVAKFVSLFDRLGEAIHEPVEEIVGQVLSGSEYQQCLRDSEDPADQERLANIEELLTAAREFDAEHAGRGTLEEFLEASCLTGDTDAWEADDDRVTLMTLHASKGLEFPVVFIIALEEGLLPHEFNRESPARLEEERRLFFVGITRARHELWLSHAHYREFRGRRKMTVPSPFLFELPRDDFEQETQAWPRRYESAPWPSEESQEVSYEHEGVDVPPASADAVAALGAQRAPLPTSRHAPSAVPREFLDPSFASAKGLRLTTAAELAGGASRLESAVEADRFHQGMRVTHPEYGLGKIIALSGQGILRRATVAFASGAGDKKFVLSKSPLRPAE